MNNPPVAKFTPLNRKKDKLSMKINTSNKSGFTLVEIMIVVAIIGLLAAIAIPNFVKARTTSQMNACINNLRQISGATQQWALESKASPNDPVVYANIQPYLKSSITCPSGGSTATTFDLSYTLNGITNNPECKILPTAGHVLPLDTTE